MNISIPHESGRTIRSDLIHMIKREGDLEDIGVRFKEAEGDPI